MCGFQILSSLTLLLNQMCAIHQRIYSVLWSYLQTFVYILYQIVEGIPWNNFETEGKDKNRSRISWDSIWGEKKIRERENPQYLE